MAIIETEGLILKSYSLAEADKIVVFLTQQEGLVRGVAKGAKRLKSRFGGGLEPFSIVDLIYYQKEERELVSIRQVELQRSFFANAGSPGFLQRFSYLAELLADFSPPHEANERLYRMAKICLETASENPSELDSITVYFELWLLRLSGYLPFWDKCNNCHREFSKNESANLQVNFQLLCQNCQKSNRGFVISPEQRQMFLILQTISPAKFLEYAANKQSSVKEISAILKRIISHILGKESVGEKTLVAIT